MAGYYRFCESKLNIWGFSTRIDKKYQLWRIMKEVKVNLGFWEIFNNFLTFYRLDDQSPCFDHHIQQNYVKMLVLAHAQLATNIGFVYFQPLSIGSH